MKIKFENFTFDENVINEIERKCFSVGAHDFNKYLHECKFGGKPIIKVLQDLKGKKEYEDIVSDEKDLHLSIDQQKSVVINFYKSLNNELGLKIEQILLEKDPRYCVNITQNTSESCDGGVSTKNNSNLIHIDINLDSGVHGLRVLAHEMSHAVSACKTKSYDLINNGSKTAIEDYFRHLGKFSVDSIGEIESHITEFLFMDYLTNQRIITKDDYQNFEDRRNNSTINNLKTIIEESYILDNISPPITPDKFEKFEKKIGGIIKTKKYKTLMNRSKFMFERDEHSGYSQYDFRYVIGEVVSSNWFEKYSQSNEHQKREMINTFIDYLTKTDQFELQDASLLLLNSGIGKTIETYENIQEKNV